MKGRTAGIAVSLLCVAGMTAPAAGAAAGGTFTQHASMNTGRSAPVLAPLPGGRVLVAGGAAANGTPLASAEIFDGATNKFTPTGNLVTARSDAAAAPLTDGRVLVVGGFGGGTSAEIFDPATGTFTSLLVNMSVGRSGAAAVSLPGGRVLIAGGDDGDDSFTSAETFDTANGFLTAGIGAMSQARGETMGAQLPDGRPIILGGNTSETSSDIFDPSAKTFAAGPTLPRGSFDGGAAPLPDGRVIVAGGFVLSGGGFQGSNTAELFDPATGTSTIVSGLPSAVTGARLAPLPDGRVLIAGGEPVGSSGALKTAATFSLTPPAGRLAFTVKGASLIVETPVAGKVSVTGAAGKKIATAAKRKKKRPRPLGSSAATGGPGQISVKLKLLGAAKARFKRTGKLTVRASINFSPTAKPQECLPFFTQCYSRGFFSGQTETLKLKGKKKKKKAKKG